MTRRYFKSDLKSKALKCAVDDFDAAHDRATAKKVYLKWEVFHNEPLFKDAIERKRKYFQNKKDGDTRTSN